MFRGPSLALLLAGAALAGPAAAQTPAATPMPVAGTTFMTDQAIGQFRASKFIGLNVYGPENARVGDINEILIDGTGNAQAVVIGVGGFLGIGEKNVAVPWSAVTWVNTRNPAATATVGGVMNPPPAPTSAATDPNAGTTARPARSPDEEAAYNGYPDHGTIALTKSDLQNAPTFKYYADTHPSATVVPSVLPPAGTMPSPSPTTPPRP